MNQLSTLIQSSQDPSEVANKVKGAILVASSIIIFFAATFFHVTLTANDMITLGTELGAIAGAVWTIYGCILHVVTLVGTVRKNNSA